jgi:IS6 family transposase
MPITPTNPFKGRQFPGEVIMLCVRWYLRYPLAYEHVAELLAERGVEVDPSCIWRWVQQQCCGPEETVGGQEGYRYQEGRLEGHGRRTLANRVMEERVSQRAHP